MTPIMTAAEASGEWDAIVIGAGPAGSLAARELARRGVRVLLVEKTTFPRMKVCGCCLNHVAMTVLERAGLGKVTTTLGGERLDCIRLLSARGASARLPLAQGIAISRSRLDAALAEAAVEAGAAFLPGCSARIEESARGTRRVRLGPQTEAVARIVIAADGLAGTSLEHVPGFAPAIAPRSRIGVGIVMRDTAIAVERNTVTLVCGRRGYVGVVQVEDGQVDVAAAVDQRWVRSAGGPGPAVTGLLARVGIQTQVKGATWRGTPPLSRRRRIEAERLLVIGDAAGYVEPFTGEGMAWALAGAEAASAYACDRVLCARGQRGKSWSQIHRGIVGQGQRQCRILSRLLRSPQMTTAAIRAISLVPRLASPVTRRINRIHEVPA